MLEYLTLKPEVFGIDISDLSLKIVKLKKKRGILSLASFGEMEIKPGIIEGGEIKNKDALVKIIQEALSRVKGEKIKTKYLAASLPEEKAFLQVIQMPLMKKDELRKAVYFEAENYIPMSAEKVYLDAQIVEPIVDHLDHVDVLMAAMPQKTVDLYAESFRALGLKPLIFEIESQAIARAMVKGERSLEPLLLIDLGATRTSFIIFSGNSLRFTTSLPISSRKFTENLAAHLKIGPKEAEALNKKYGIEGKKGRDIFAALEPDLENLVHQIKKYLDYYETHSSHEHLAAGAPKKISAKKIILCGGAANLKGLDDFLSQELKLQVILGNPWVNILPQPFKELPELPYEESLSYATALGLALRGTNL